MPEINSVQTTATAAVDRPSSAGSTALLGNARFASNSELGAIAAGRGVLSAGASGEAVSMVQGALLDMGFAMKPYTSTSGRPVGGVDGSWGPQTSRALANFQRHARHFFPSVQPTGELDQATLKALDRLAPSPGRKAWDEGESPKAPRPIWARTGADLKVVVVKDEHRTFLYDGNGTVKGIYANSIGKGSTPTDTGLKKVTGKLSESDARSVGSRLWGDPRAFGVRIIDLSWVNGRRSGEELHGTFADAQLGMDVSHGCMRHHNEDILKLFAAVRVGDTVAVVERIDAPELGAPIGRA